MRDSYVIAVVIVAFTLCFLAGYKVRDVAWQQGTPEPYAKVIAEYGGNEVEAMYSGLYWTEYRVSDGIVGAYQGAPTRWHYTFW